MARRSKKAEEEEEVAQPAPAPQPQGGGGAIAWRAGPLAGTPVMGGGQPQRPVAEAASDPGEGEGEEDEGQPQAGGQPAPPPPPPGQPPQQLPEPMERLRQRVEAVRELTSGRDEIERLAEAARLVQYFRQIGVDVDPQLVLKAMSPHDEDEGDLVRLARELLRYRELARLVDSLDPEARRRGELEEAIAKLSERLDRIEKALEGGARGYSELEALDRMVELIKKVNEYQAQIAQIARPPEGWVGAVASIINALRPVLEMIRAATMAQGGQAPELPKPP